MPELTIITTSVNYSDYLRLTLPENSKYGRVIVATSPEDTETVAVAQLFGAECLPTTIWHRDGDPFNKGAGINAALEYAKPTGWVLLLDSDIVLTPPPIGFQRLNKLDEACLYGVRRRSCHSEAVWTECAQQRSWYDLPVDPLPPVKGQRVWGGRPTANPIGLQGYFQLWHYPTAPHSMFEYKTAAKYDVELALKWTDNKRKLLPWRDYTVLHLGHARRNWRGRRTALWDVSPIPTGALEEAATQYYG